MTVSLDRESARAMGLPVLALDIVLYVLVTISVVLGLQTVSYTHLDVYKRQGEW